MEFEWNEAKNHSKNRSNIRKHGIGFELAQRIFDGPVLTRLDHRKDYGEDRFVSIGTVDGVAVVVVVHTDREERVRLISARTASRRETRAYYEQIQKTSYR